jgi:RHS repeat-associated protein
MESVRKILNDSQTTTDAYTFEAFGNPTGQSGTTVNPFRYVGALGYYSDRTSGLRLLGARYYGPSPRRFWTQDPIRYPGVNAYPYVASNPVNRTDPSGLGAACEFACVAFAALCGFYYFDCFEACRAVCLLRDLDRCVGAPGRARLCHSGGNTVNCLQCEGRQQCHTCCQHLPRDGPPGHDPDRCEAACNAKWLTGGGGY